MIYDLRTLQAWPNRAQINGRWVPARPIEGPFVHRLRAAWQVLRGRADAFSWPEGQ